MSKLALGTAQFGLDYGISNVHGKTDKHNVNQILEFAYNNNIDTIDTAAMYGNAESVVGGSINNSHSWNIVTKTPYFSNDCIDKTCVKKLRESFKKSLLNLGKKNIYGLLIHSCDDLFKPGGSLLFKEMEALKSIGAVEKIGVSVYSSRQIEMVLNKFNIDLIQLPINILDQNLLIDGWLKKIKEKGIEIHARSVFLQGVLLMPRHTLPAYFSDIYNNIEDFIGHAHKLSLSCAELALGFVQNIDEIDKIIVGVNTINQLREIIEAKQVDLDIIEFRRISVNDPNYTNPSLWKL